MDIKSIFGLPAHPLLVHVPVVLLPLTAIGAVLMLWESWRRRIGWIVVGMCFASGIFVQLAIGSGQQLRQYVRRSAALHQHAQLADQLRPFVLLLFLVLLGVMALDWYRQRDPEAGPHLPGWLRSHGLATAMGIFAIVVAAGTLTWVFRTGDSGAKATWERTQQKMDRGEGGEVPGGDSNR